MSHWYKDRDFPEIKRPIDGEPSEILGCVENPKDLAKIIEAHNEEVDALEVRYKNLLDQHESATKIAKEKAMEQAISRVQYVRFSFVLADDDYTRGYINACKRIRDELEKLI